MNVFKSITAAEKYDRYYETGQGKKVDAIEKELVSGFLKRIPGDEMLELGCGTGHWTEFFCNAGFHVTAVDNSDEMLRIAGEKNISNAVFQKADAADLPCADRSFGVIASITMLEFADHVDEIMDEIDRVLKPGGFLLLGCLNDLSELGKKKDSDEVFRKAHFFTPEEIKQLMARFGTPDLKYSVYYSETFELLDGTEKQNTVQPAFIAACAQKKYKR